MAMLHALRDEIKALKASQSVHGTQQAGSKDSIRTRSPVKIEQTGGQDEEPQVELAAKSTTEL
jgi:hypothetical protein